MLQPEVLLVFGVVVVGLVCFCQLAPFQPLLFAGGKGAVARLDGVKAYLAAI